MGIKNFCNLFKFLLIYSSLFQSITASSFCGFNQITRSSIPRNNTQARNLQSSYTREANWNPIRIHVDILDSSISFSAYTYIEQIIQNSIQWYRNVLNIKRLTSKLLIDASFDAKIAKDEEFNIPEKYYTEGVDTDFIFFIKIVTRPNAPYVGYADYLQLDCITNQPVIGFFVINYRQEKKYSYEDVLITTIHEMAHALVFNPLLYYFYVDSYGNPYEQVIVEDIVRGVSVKKIATPNVVKYARKTFNCPTLNGVELELTGKDGSAMFHWDKRIMNGDFMVASMGVKDFVFSDITLGLFEDSGWYLPNYEYTQQITLGYQLGCSFIEEKCIEDQKPTNDVFCIDDGNYHCDYNRLNKGKCKMKIYEETIPYEYSYFGDSNSGSPDIFIDYCPIIIPVTGGNCRYHDSLEIELNPDYGEQACENCRCVEGTYSKDNEAHDHVGCHWIECEDDRTIVHIGDEEIECSEDGGVVNVPNYNGVLYCPKWTEVCKPVPCMNSCSGIGICNRGVCKCPDGSMGGDCSKTKKDFSYRDHITLTLIEDDSSMMISLMISVVLLLI